MAADGTGIATIDFGAFPGKDQVVTTVTGVTGIAADSTVEAWFMADTTPGHTANDHAYAAGLVALVAGNIVPGVGFDIIASCISPANGKMQGSFKVRWVWA